MCCGLVIACSSVAFASDSIQALLFPASFEINGSNVALNNEYKVLNVDGHAYVPIRFVAENMEATIDYDAESKKIFIKNGNLDLTDPDYKGISVGNLILTKVGKNTKVTGQLKINGVGNTKNMVGANLSFYNDNSEKVGEAAITGNNFGVESQIFMSEGSGDFRTYSTVNLHIGAVNNNIISETPSVIYENTKHNFTLNLPKSWEGKYDVVEGTDTIDFINIANKEAGWGGVLFTIQIWSKEKWSTEGVIAKQNIHISKIGDSGDEIFTLSTPTDVNYNVNDEKLKAEYASMWDHINTIKTTFKDNNELNSNIDYLASLNIVLPQNWHVDTSQKVLYDLINEKGENGGFVSTSAYEENFDFEKPNHSSIINDEYVNIPFGKCRLITLDVDNGTAASGITGTHNEYYAVIPVKGKITYILSFSKKDKELQSKEQFIEILKSLSLK
jgi:hypothetical protein